MTIILKSENSGSISNPSATKISIFYDEDTKNIFAKKKSGNIAKIGNTGQSFYTFTFNETNSDTTNINAGTVYLNSGELSISSSVYCGTILGLSNCVVDLYKENDNSLIASWTVVSSTLTNKTLTNSASLNASDWYSIRFRLQNAGSGDTAILKGIRLVFD